MGARAGVSGVQVPEVEDAREGGGGMGWGLSRPFAAPGVAVHLVGKGLDSARTASASEVAWRADPRPLAKGASSPGNRLGKHSQ